MFCFCHVRLLVILDSLPSAVFSSAKDNAHKIGKLEMNINQSKCPVLGWEGPAHRLAWPVRSLASMSVLLALVASPVEMTDGVIPGLRAIKTTWLIILKQLKTFEPNREFFIVLFWWIWSNLNSCFYVNNKESSDHILVEYYFHSVWKENLTDTVTVWVSWKYCFSGTVFESVPWLWGSYDMYFTII